MATMNETPAVPYTLSALRSATSQASEKENVADAVVEHGGTEHHHALDREVVLVHLEGVHPYDRETWTGLLQDQWGLRAKDVRTSL